MTPLVRVMGEKPRQYRGGTWGDPNVRARTAWLLAIDLANDVVDGSDFMKTYLTPEKVGRGSDARTTMARKIACYLTCVVAEVFAADAARAARLHRKTVASHLADIEDMRDDAGFDRLLEDLREAMIRRACDLVMASLGGAGLGAAA